MQIEFISHSTNILIFLLNSRLFSTFYQRCAFGLSICCLRTQCLGCTHIQLKMTLEFMSISVRHSRYVGWNLLILKLIFFSFVGYMLLFLTVLQMLSLFCTHLLITRTAASILLMLFILAITSVGGYTIHIGEIPSYLWWSETFSPQRWLLPIIISDEFSQETLANTAGQQLCRNKHVCFSFITIWVCEYL